MPRRRARRPAVSRRNEDSLIGRLAGLALVAMVFRVAKVAIRLLPRPLFGPSPKRLFTYVALVALSAFTIIGLASNIDGDLVGRRHEHRRLHAQRGRCCNERDIPGIGSGLLSIVFRRAGRVLPGPAAGSVPMYLCRSSGASDARSSASFRLRASAPGFRSAKELARILVEALLASP
jgi:hypothetical protein